MNYDLKKLFLSKLRTRNHFYCSMNLRSLKVSEGQVPPSWSPTQINQEKNKIENEELTEKNITSIK